MAGMAKFLKMLDFSTGIMHSARPPETGRIFSEIRTKAKARHFGGPFSILIIGCSP
jgi:hypothetical protein